VVWILMVVQALVSACGLVLLRFSMPLLLATPRQLTYISIGAGALGVVAYAASFILWLFILSRNPVTFAFPITTAITIASTTVLAWAVLGETVTGTQIIGICLLCVAIFFVGRG
jgi:multidrug transporter EmrE-like cation transporter